MRILLLSKRHYTGMDLVRERFGRLYHLPRTWQQAGHVVSLFLLDYRSAVTATLLLDELEVISVGCRALGLLRSYPRLLDLAQAADVIVSSGDIHFGVIGQWLAARYGRRHVFDVYDDYEMFGSARIPGMKAAYHRVLARADGVMCASASVKTELERRRASVLLIPNGVDVGRFRPMDRQACKARWQLAKEIEYIGYFGGLSAERGTLDLIEAVRLLRERRANIVLLLAGTPSAMVVPNEPWIRFIGQVPHADIPLLINACAVVTLPYRSSPFMDQGSSSKIAEYFFCGVPLVATRTPNLLNNFPRQAKALEEGLCQAAAPSDMARALEFQLVNRRVPGELPAMSWESIGEAALALVTGAPPGIRSSSQ